MAFVPKTTEVTKDEGYGGAPAVKSNDGFGNDAPAAPAPAVK